MTQHLVVARFFYVQDFAFQRQNRLEFTVAAHFCGPARRFPLNHKQFASRRIALLAIRQFSRQSARIHRRFAPCQFTRFAGRRYTGCGLFQSVLGVADFDSDLLSQLFAPKFSLPVFEFRSVLIGLRHSIPDGNIQTESDIVIRGRVIECVAQRSGEIGRHVGGIGDSGNVVSGVQRSRQTRSAVESQE